MKEKKQKQPKYTYEYLKQSVWEAAYELVYHQKKLSDMELAEILFGVVAELDKYSVAPKCRKKSV